MKIIKKKFTSILLAIVLSSGVIFAFNFALKTEAASQTMGDLTVDYPGSGALFSASNIAPGYEEVKIITITNNGSVNHSFSIALSGAVGTLATALRFEPRNFDTKTPYWNHTLREIADSGDGYMVLPAISPGQTAQIDLAALLPVSTGNEYQATQVETFGIIFGVDSTFTLENEIIPVFGGSSSDTNIEVASLETGGTSPLPRGRGIGGSVAESPGSTDSPDSGSLDATADRQTLGSEQEVKGTSTGSLIYCFWWWILLIVLAVFLIIYGWLTHKREIYLRWLWPVVGGLILFIAHLIFHEYYTPSKYCPYFVWIELGELAVYYAIVTATRKKSGDENLAP